MDALLQFRKDRYRLIANGLLFVANKFRYPNIIVLLKAAIAQEERKHTLGGDAASAEPPPSPALNMATERGLTITTLHVHIVYE